MSGYSPSSGWPRCQSLPRDLPAMVHLIVALRAEARPLVSHFGLQRRDRGTSSLPVFSAPGMRLVISGVGKGAAKGAVERLVEAAEEVDQVSQPVWLNVGLAGHRELERGSVRLAHKVTDVARGRSWYPPLVVESRIPGAEVRTVDWVERSFESEALFDMEAAGFFPAAARVSTRELVQVLKVVSDNERHATEKINGRWAGEWIEAAIPALERLMEGLVAVREALVGWTGDPAGMKELMEHWHFSVTQRRQLQNLLRRLQALRVPGFTAECLVKEFSSCHEATELIQRLRAQLRAQPARVFE